MMSKHNQMNAIPAVEDEDQDDLFNAINRVEQSNEEEDHEVSYNSAAKNPNERFNSSGEKAKPVVQNTLFNADFPED